MKNYSMGMPSMREMQNEKKKWYLDKPEDSLIKLLQNRHGIFYNLLGGDNWDDDDDFFDGDFEGPCPCCGSVSDTLSLYSIEQTKSEFNSDNLSAQQMFDDNLKNILAKIETADVNECHENLGTPLHWATWQHNNIPGTLEIIQKLIQYGANVNALNRFGKTPLYDICDNNCKGVSTEHYQKSDIDVVKLLIDSGTNVNLGNPLLAAADRDNVELVKYLISLGADVNQKDSRGNSPLSKAIKSYKQYSEYHMNKYNAIVKTLVEAGADLYNINEYGRDAYNLANNNKEISEYLEGLKEKHTFVKWLKVVSKIKN